jgi:hypothetical protein
MLTLLCMLTQLDLNLASMQKCQPILFVFGLKSFDFMLQRIIVLQQNFKCATYWPIDKFKQDSKQKRMVGCFLEIYAK